MKEQTKCTYDTLAETVKRQRKMNDFPAVREAFNGLSAAGYDEDTILDMCVKVLAVEHLRAAVDGELLDDDLYQWGLRRLPVMPWEEDDSDYPADFEEEDIQSQVFDNPNCIMMTEENVLKIYRHLRSKRNRINNLLVERVKPKLFRRSAHELGAMQADTIVIDSEDTIFVVMDYCIYANPVQRSEFVADYYEEYEELLDEDDIEILRAMEDAKYMLLHYQRPIRGLGIHVKDILTDQTFVLADVSLSVTMVPNTLIASHVIAPYGIHMTTGAPLPVLEKKALDDLEKILTSYAPPKVGTIDTTKDRGRFAALVIRMLLKRGVLNRVRFA